MRYWRLRIFRTLSNLGLDEKIDPARARGIRVLNRACLMMSLYLAVRIAILAASSQPWAALYYVPPLLIFLAVLPLLVLRGYFQVAIHTGLFTGNAGVFFLGYFLFGGGWENTAYAIMFPLSFAPMILFHPEERFARRSWMGLNMALLALLLILVHGRIISTPGLSISQPPNSGGTGLPFPIGRSGKIGNCLQVKATTFLIMGERSRSKLGFAAMIYLSDAIILPVPRSWRRPFSLPVLALVVLIGGTACTYGTDTRRAEAGFLDLSDYHFEKPVRLDGEWEFYWRQLIPPEHFKNGTAGEPAYYHEFPEAWNGREIDGNILDGDGFATFRLKVRLPEEPGSLAVRTKEQPTAIKLFINSDVAFAEGTVGENARKHEPDLKSVLAFFSRDPGDEFVELVLWISNFSHRRGGIRHSIYIGRPETIIDYIRNIRFKDIFLSGLIFIIIIYHVVIYSVRPGDKLSLYFALFALVILLRHMLTGERLLLELFPDFTYDIYKKMEYLTFFYGAIFLIHFLRQLYPESAPKWVLYILHTIIASFSVFVLATPARIFSCTAQPYQVLYLLQAAFVGFILIKATIQRRQYGLFLLSGSAIMIGTSINDILYANRLVQTGYLLHFGMFAFVIAQSTVVSFNFATAFNSAERLAEKLKATNVSYARFVPEPLLKMIRRTDITEVKLGDQIEREITLLFCDIRGFTPLSESMSPEENFNFLNAYLKRVSPAITNHNGFIDKYIGDAIMALFSEKPSDAVRAAVDMQRIIRNYNEHREQRGYEPISVGMGIHFGNVMLGTIGEESRLEATAISDTVNTAARIETLTKRYSSDILVSETVLHRLEDPAEFDFRYIDTVTVKGRTGSVSVFEVFSGRADSVIDIMRATKADFERGVQAFHDDRFAEAQTYFNRVHKQNPTDESAVYYLQRLKKGQTDLD